MSAEFDTENTQRGICGERPRKENNAFQMTADFHLPICCRMHSQRHLEGKEQCVYTAQRMLCVLTSQSHPEGIQKKISKIFYRDVKGSARWNVQQI